jgi:3-methyladenine DNA glycosylase AlkC
MPNLSIPKTAGSITKGVPLKLLLDQPAINQLAHNLHEVYPAFNQKEFIRSCMNGLQELTLKERSIHIAQSMKAFLPKHYSEAIAVLLQSLTPPIPDTNELGTDGMFYMPHISFIERYGLDYDYNGGKDPFEVSMKAQYAITQRHTAEFSIRTFILHQPERTFEVLYNWMNDPDPHIRRLCSEGSRPRLPWASKIEALVKDPSPSLSILERLKDDSVRYVTRSVANHIGDIAKDHLDLALDICESWLSDADKEVKWIIRHAVRHPAKKQVKRALDIRLRAK